MRKILLTIAIVIVCGGVISGSIVWYLHKPAPIIPASIEKQTSFAIFYPMGGQTTIMENTFKYSASLGEVSFIVNFEGQNISFAEQSSPDSFSADPTIYPQFIDKLNGYDTFQSINGQVDLVIPSTVHAQTGVMNTKGTLLFAKSSENLSENNWKLLFNLLTYTKPQ